MPFSQTLQVLISLFHLFCCPGCTHTFSAFPEALPKSLSSKRLQKLNATACLFHCGGVTDQPWHPSLFTEELQEPPPLSVYIHYSGFRGSEEVAIALNLY